MRLDDDLTLMAFVALLGAIGLITGLLLMGGVAH